MIQFSENNRIPDDETASQSTTADERKLNTRGSAKTSDVPAIPSKRKGSGLVICMPGGDVHLSGPGDFRAFVDALGGSGGPGAWAAGYPERLFADGANGTQAV